MKTYDGNNPYFFWSINEVEVAKRKSDNYWVYLVNRKEMCDDDYIPRMEQNPIENIMNNKNWDKQIEKYKVEMNSQG